MPSTILAKSSVELGNHGEVFHIQHVKTTDTTKCAKPWLRRLSDNDSTDSMLIFPIRPDDNLDQSQSGLDSFL